MKYITKTDLYVVCRYLGIIMQGVGLILLLPIFVALIYQENTYIGFIIPSLISIGLGTLLRKTFEKHTKLRLKHGMIISSLAWLWAGLIGSAIMMLCLNVSFVDAFFENISAWTGSGLTLFANVEILPKSILFLRSLEQWLGGLGVVVIFIGILIRSGTAAARLYKSEAREDKIKPSIANTLKKTLQIYLIYTAFGIFLYILAGMPIFDSINLTFTSIATGGMSIKNANVGYYQNDLIYLITIILMILGATSFAVHYKVIKTKGKAIFKDIQFQTMIALILIVSLLIYLTSTIIPIEVLFNVVSAITTTGASVTTSSAIALWPGVTLVLIMILMTIGGSSGSTVGAIKLVRIITFLKGIHLTITNIISPEGRILPMKISGREISDKGIREADAYIVLYLGFIVLGWMIMVGYGYNPLNALFETISAQGNVGLSIGITNINMPLLIKLSMIFQMWIGRLEIIPVIVILRSIYELFKLSKPKKGKVKKVKN